MPRSATGGDVGTYFVTRGTGFLGRRLVARLLARPDCVAVYVLVRERSRHRMSELTEQWPRPERVVQVIGDLTADALGVDPAGLADRIDHVHVVNVTTQGIQNHTPRFSAYLSSKAALDEFGKVAGRDLLTEGITFSSVRLPLVQTAMSAPSAKVYRRLRSLSPDQAARLIVRALHSRPEVINLPAGTAVELADRFAPHTMRALTHLAAYQAMPETAPDTRAQVRRRHPLVAVTAAATRLLWRSR
jgi:NAD(P)-dependent dehydrogenase (short-subunit alcohol dehydrogenase family)